MLSKGELKALMNEELETTCSKDENGRFYEEVYTDYRDELSDDTIKGILQEKAPMDSLYDKIEEAYREAARSLEGDVIEKLRENPELEEALEEDEDFVRETLFEIFYVKLPTDHFLDQSVDINIVLDTGDLNYDFVHNCFAHGYYGDNDEPVHETSSLLWLCRQQGVTKEELEQALQTGQCYPPEMDAISAHHKALRSEMKELGYNEANYANHSGAFRTLHNLKDNIRKQEHNLKRQMTILADCELSYEAYCEKWVALAEHNPFYKDRPKTPPTREEWAKKREVSLAHTQKAVESIQFGIEECQNALQKELQQNPDVARANTLSNQYKESLEQYVPMIHSEEYGKWRFLESVIRESENTSSHMNALAALVSMPLRDAIKLTEVFQAEADLNDSYYPEERKGLSSITLSKNSVLGLYDPWNGAGGIFEIELSKPLEIPVRLIHDANVDGNLGYGILGIYGSMEYGDTLESINEVLPELTKLPLDQRLQAADAIVASQQAHPDQGPEHQNEQGR